MTVTTDDDVAPDGNTTADKLNDSASTSGTIFQTRAFTAADEVVYSMIVRNIDSIKTLVYNTGDAKFVHSNRASATAGTDIITKVDEGYPARSLSEKVLRRSR